VAEGGLARAARSKREAGSQFGRNYHGGAPGVWGYLGGKKKYLQIGHGCNYIDVHPKWHPRGRWLNFEDAAAATGSFASLVACLCPWICHHWGLGSSFLLLSSRRLQLSRSESRKRYKSATTHALPSTHLCTFAPMHPRSVLQEVDLDLGLSTPYAGSSRPASSRRRNRCPAPWG
jgi:hypothetical protein